MYNKLFLFIFLISLLSSNSVAQNPQSFRPAELSIIPPSPEVASLMKYIDYPVSLFTGQPSITLPLYSIKSGSLEIPISISYHGGGIKVNELSGIVGLGWNLNAGGCITRTVHGYPDEAPHCNKVHWGWSNTNAITGVLNLDYNERVNLRQHIIDREGINYALDEFNDALPYSVTHNYEDGKIDVANDVFTFNCQGLNGTFIFDPDTKQMILSTSSRISFDPTSKSANYGWLPESFIMYDDMMNRYEFDTMEDTRLVYHTNNTDSLYYISTWHLTKLISANKDTVIFKYSEPTPKREFIGSSQSLIYRWRELPSTGETQTSVSTVHYYSRLLNEIESKNTRVCFQYDNTRTRLQKISIYNHIPDTTPIKEFEFITENLTLGTCYSNNHIPYSYKGVFLKEIHENDLTANGYICLYSFDYESSYNSSNYMYAQDEWGYYNGRENGGFLIQLGANRDIDSVYSKNGVLKRITYATGGKTEFEWEQNSYSYERGSRISMATQQQEVETTTEHHLYARTEDNLDFFSRANVATDYFNTTYNINIGSQTTKKRIRINLQPFIKQLMDSRSALYHEQSPYYYQHSELYDLTTTRDARVELYNPQNQIVKTWFIDNSQCSKNEIDTMIYGNNGTGFYKIKLRYPYNWYLETSNQITASDIRNLLMNGGIDNATGQNGYIKIRVSSYSSRPQSFSKPWGGLRIKSIKTYSLDSPPIVKSYIYADSINGRCSSGTILELPEYDSYYCDAFAGNQELNFGVIVNEFKVNYSNGIYSTPCGGSKVEYPYVWEVMGDNNYSVRNEYDSQRYSGNCDIKDVYCDYIPSMSRIYTSQDFKRGNLIERKFYKDEQLYKKEHFDYDIRYNDNTPVFCGDFVKILHVSGFGELDEDYETCRYKLLPFNITMTRASSYEYYTSDGILHNTDENAYRTERTFTYANNQSFNDAIWATYKLSESFMNSDSTIYTSYYTYINRNGFNLNMPETQVLVARRPHSSSSVIVSAKRFVYDNSNNLVATYRGRSGINADTYSLGEGLHAPSSLLATLNIPEFTYQYNDKGQLVEIRYKGIPLASYLWGYRGTYPIAEIRGIGYNDVFSALPNNLKPECLYNRYDITENDLASIRTFFPSNEVTTLTYNWLIGIGSITDTHGITTRFYYDGYGRLESVKDWNNYYIQKYDYHYVNQ